MLELKYGIEELIEFPIGNSTQIKESIIETVVNHNYKVVKVKEKMVVFESYGDKPVSRHESLRYMDRGIMELTCINSNQLLRLSYSISYLSEIWFAVLIVFIALAMPWALLSFIPILAQFFYRIKATRFAADQMMTDAIDRIKNAS